MVDMEIETEMVDIMNIDTEISNINNVKMEIDIEKSEINNICKQMKNIFINKSVEELLKENIEKKNIEKENIEKIRFLLNVSKISNNTLIEYIRNMYPNKFIYNLNNNNIFQRQILELLLEKIVNNVLLHKKNNYKKSLFLTFLLERICINHDLYEEHQLKLIKLLMKIPYVDINGFNDSESKEYFGYNTSVETLYITAENCKFQSLELLLTHPKINFYHNNNKEHIIYRLDKKEITSYSFNGSMENKKKVMNIFLNNEQVKSSLKATEYYYLRDKYS